MWLKKRALRAGQVKTIIKSLVCENLVCFEPACLLSPEPEQVHSSESGGRMLPSGAAGTLGKYNIEA